MKILLHIDKRLMLFLCLFPIIWDFFAPNWKNNELISLLWIIMICLWQLAAGKALYRATINSRKSSVIIFQAVFIFVILYQTMSAIFIHFDIDDYIPYADFVIRLSGSIGYLWGIAFISTMLVELEAKRAIKSNGLFTFALIFVLPVGIWWIQPRIQSVLSNYPNSGYDNNE